MDRTARLIGSGLILTVLSWKGGEIFFLFGKLLRVDDASTGDVPIFPLLSQIMIVTFIASIISTLIFRLLVLRSNESEQDQQGEALGIGGMLLTWLVGVGLACVGVFLLGPRVNTVIWDLARTDEARSAQNLLIGCGVGMSAIGVAGLAAKRLLSFTSDKGQV